MSKTTYNTLPTHINSSTDWIITGPNYTTTTNTSDIVFTSNTIFDSNSTKWSLRGSDITLEDGSNLEETLNQIKDRLAILTPDPKLLDKYEALKKAYDQYKFLEKLLLDSSSKSK